MTTDLFTDADVERAGDAIRASLPMIRSHLRVVVDTADSVDEVHDLSMRAFNWYARAVLASLTPEAMLDALTRAGVLDQIRAQAKAEALREAADFLDEASRLNPSGNTPMYISAMGLRQRADQIEEAKSDG